MTAEQLRLVRFGGITIGAAVGIVAVGDLVRRRPFWVLGAIFVALVALVVEVMTER